MISIADDVFGPGRDRRGHSNETIVLTGVFDVSTAEAALRSMGRRFMMVDETGMEHASMKSLEEAEDQDLYSPNYVSEPRPTEEGIKLYVLRAMSKVALTGPLPAGPPRAPKGAGPL